MAQQLFAYIGHKDGLADDSALELVTAARKIYPDAIVTAIIAGSGTELEAVSSAVAASYPEVWKFDNAALAYPNGEVLRNLLLNNIPADAIILFAHDTLGMDLAPGLSIKLDSAFVSDAVDIEGVDGNDLKVIRPAYIQLWILVRLCRLVRVCL